MPPRRKSSSKKKKEVLPDPATVTNGECDYYIGTWSYYEKIDAISDIAHNVVEQHTSAEGEVGELPRTTVLIPACNLGNAATHYAVEVANNMFIESVPMSSMKNTGQVQKDAAAVAAGEGDNEGMMEPQEAAAEAQEKEAAEADESPKRNVQHHGASASANDVILQGTVHIDGILTRIVIKPDLPEPPAPPKTKRKSSTKRRKSAKATEEEQQRLAEEARIYEEKVNAAVKAAKEEEEFRMQFAHPNRWSRVVFLNMTFAGQVIVSHAHVTFRNCCFSARGPNITQLLVTQYCEVECIKCTFECPTKGSVYGFPMGKMTFKECLFSGNETMSSVRTKESDARYLRPRAVGLHADACDVKVEDCYFTDLETGILLRGSHPDTTAEKLSMVVQSCKLNNIFGSGVVLDNVRGVELKKNKFTECDYYSLDCIKGNDIRVFQNTFLSKVRVQNRAHVEFMHNKSGTVPLALKEVDNPNWQPVY